jgi:hypothetical protein
MVNVGVAAHITAASAGGPRYNPELSPEQRRHIDNGIWLCQNCAKLIDSDISRFNEALLRAWRIIAEDRARNSLGKTATPARTVEEKAVPKLELCFSGGENAQNDTYSHEPVRKFVLGITNNGCATAKFLRIRYRRTSGLTVDLFGIDGNSNFGIPRAPSDYEWEIFRGGADQVINPGETLNITKLLQRGRIFADQRGPDGQSIAQWAFDAIKFECEISAEGISMVRAEKTAPAKLVPWPNY